MQYVVSCDIAQKYDFFAIQIYRDTPELRPAEIQAGVKEKIEHKWDLVYMDQMNGIPYNIMADKLVKLVTQPRLYQNHDLIVDGTGIGVAVVDELRDRGLMPIPIVATGGGKVNVVYEDMANMFKWTGKFRGFQTVKEYRVPKVEMVQCGQVALENKMVRLAPNLPYTEAFKEQLVGFKGRFNDKTMYTKYNAATEDLHDDLITCFLQAMWWVSNKKENSLKRDNQENTEDMPEWSPLKRS